MWTLFDHPNFVVAYLQRIDTSKNDFKWHLSVNKVPYIVLYPSYYRSESVVYSNHDSVINVESLVKFILLNSYNLNTLKGFLHKNCIYSSATNTKTTFDCCGNSFKNILYEKFSHLNRELNHITEKVVHIEQTILNSINLTYFHEYSLVLEKKRKQISAQIDSVKIFLE